MGSRSLIMLMADVFEVSGILMTGLGWMFGLCALDVACQHWFVVALLGVFVKELESLMEVSTVSFCFRMLCSVFSTIWAIFSLLWMVVVMVLVVVRLWFC